MRPGSVLVTTLVLLAAATGASGCDDTPPRPAVDELSIHEDQPCPGALVDPEDEHGFGTETAAERAPDPARPDRAWVCGYEAVEEPHRRSDSGAYYSWLISEEATVLDDADLAAVTEATASLAPVTGKEFCTADLGPRVLVVTARGNDLTGYVVDAYGCGDIRMTDDPFTSPPGVATQPGTVSGVLRSDELARVALRLLGSPR